MSYVITIITSGSRIFALCSAEQVEDVMTLAILSVPPHAEIVSISMRS